VSRRVGLLGLVALLATLACSKRESRRTGIEADTTRPQADWLEVEPVRLLHEYVRIDTREKNGEQEGALFLRRLFDCEGIENEVVCPALRRCNLLARLPGKKREGALLLLNHIDVAETYARWWEEPPFAGTIKRGYLYGRGTYDMKSLALAQALALRRLKRHGVVPNSDILFLAEADEESGQRWGSAWLLAHRPEWFKGVAEVLNEGGSNEMILRDVRYWGIETVQAGYASGDFEAAGEVPLAELAKRWPRLPGEPVEPHPHVVLGFDMLANHLVMPLTDLLRHLERVRKNPSELAQLPDRYASFLEPRIHWFPPYPYPPGTKGRFRSDVLISVPPGRDPGPLLSSILEDASAAGLRVVQSVSSGVSPASPYPTRFTELLKRITEAHYPGIPFGPMPTFAGFTTSILFRQKGFSTYGYSPIPMNIFDAVRRHGNDERIYLRDYLSGVELYEDVVAEYATNP
jgi:acetylornithine deacetylase/succinyl-diaminopimelate desuccinylase-like protein